MKSICLALSRRCVAVAMLAGLMQAHTHVADAQTLNAQAGSAASVDLVQVANNLSMQEAYPRSLFLYLRSNPNLLNDQQFYVSLVSYLVSQAVGNDCSNAFANEFERRDYFTRSFQVQPQLQQIIASKPINRNFEVSYVLGTGQYDFTTQSLPITQRSSLGSGLDRNIGSGNARNCASQMLQGTEVSIQNFPWNFQVVDESGDPAPPRFPFEGQLQLSSNDARTLFEQFGRRLYSIVAYQVRAAADGTQRIQIIPTDAELFGLSDNAVVRVKTYAHPTLSQPTYVDFTNKLTVSSEPLGLNASLQFEQQGFRAVATGTAEGRATGVTAASTYSITGSAAVAGSSFIIRLSAPQLSENIAGLYNAPGAKRFVTLFGSIAFEQVTQTRAPVNGRAVVLEVQNDGQLRESSQFAFNGAFELTVPEPAAETANAAPAQPAPAPAPAVPSE